MYVCFVTVCAEQNMCNQRRGCQGGGGGVMQSPFHVHRITTKVCLQCVCLFLFEQSLSTTSID